MTPIACHACCRFSAPRPACEHCGATLRTVAQAQQDADMATMFIAYTVNNAKAHSRTMLFPEYLKGG